MVKPRPKVIFFFKEEKKNITLPALTVRFKGE